MAQNVYIDESGSITNEYADRYPFFVIAALHVFNKPVLKKAFKRFISSNYDELKKTDRQKKMFDSAGNFSELKGCCMTPKMKEKFLNFFSRKPLFEVFYIKLDNHRLSEKLSTNKARCFNYLLKTAFTYFITHGILPKDTYAFHIDERNIRTDAKFTLEDYLNTELLFNGVMADTIAVEYLDSCKNEMIQVADVFANIYYSYLMRGNYQNNLESMRKQNMIREIFVFPKEK